MTRRLWQYTKHRNAAFFAVGQLQKRGGPVAPITEYSTKANRYSWGCEVASGWARTPLPEERLCRS